MKTLTLAKPDWREILLAATNASPFHPPTGQPVGHDMPTHNKRLRLVRAVEALPKDATVLELEDADAEELVRAVAFMRWARVTPEIEAFGEAIEALTKKNGKATP